MLQESATELLGQIDGVIKECKEEDYSKPLEIFNGATIGQHVRHTLEFFICLFDARNDGIINYDKRNRDEVIETDKKFACAIISSIMEFLNKSEDDFLVEFEADYSFSGNSNLKMPSSFYRELSYNIEHAIHHMALLKIGVQSSLQYIKLPDHFGVASSTVRYQSGKNA